MARNPVQFQKGLSLMEFNRRYGTDEQCHAALIKMRWPDGFVCPHCGVTEHSYSAARQIFQCSGCRVQTSARAGTIFHKSRTPLVKWFLRVGEDVATLTPHRPGRAGLPHPVLHGRASLTQV